MPHVPDNAPVKPGALPTPFDTGAGSGSGAFGEAEAQALINAGKGLRQVGGQLEQVAAASQALDNESEVKKWDTERRESYRTLLYGEDGNTGFMSLKGEDAVAAGPNLVQAIKKLNRETAEKGSNAAVRSALSLTSHDATLLDNIAKKVAAERLANSITMSEGQIASANDMAANNPDFADFMVETSVTETESRMDVLGIDPESEAGKTMVREAVSIGVVQMIENTLEQDVERAKELFTTYGDLVDTKVKPNLVKKMKTSSNLAEGFDLAEKFFDPAKSRVEQDKLIRDNAGSAEAAKAGLQARKVMQAAFDKDEGDRNKAAAQAADKHVIADGLSFSTLPPDVQERTTSAHRASLRANEVVNARGAPIVTDWGEYERFRSMTPNELADPGVIASARLVMADKEFNKFVTHVDTILADKTNRSFTPTQIFTGAADALKLFGSDAKKKQRGELRNMFEEVVADKEADKGKKLTDTELLDAMDEVVKKIIVKDYNLGFIDREKRVFEVEVDEAFRTQANGIFASIGGGRITDFDRVLLFQGSKEDEIEGVSEDDRMKSIAAFVLKNRRIPNEGEIKAHVKAVAKRRAGITPIAALAGALAVASPATATAEPVISAGVINDLIQVESGGDPNTVGVVGELGLFQILPSTAKAPGIEGVTPIPDLSKATVAEQRTFTMQFLSAAVAEFGTLEWALAAYNAGFKRAKHAKSRGGIKSLPKSTKRYLDKFRKLGTI